MSEVITATGGVKVETKGNSSGVGGLIRYFGLKQKEEEEKKKAHYSASV